MSSSTQLNDTEFEGHKVEKALKFRYQIYNIQNQAQEMLQWANEKAKARHDKHHIPYSLEIGYHVLLLLKEWFNDPYKKLKPLRYGPYNILK